MSVLAGLSWAADADRGDPVEVLVEQNLTREPDLVPVRHGRMSTRYADPNTHDDSTFAKPRQKAESMRPAALGFPREAVTP